MGLFDDEFQPDESPADATNILTLLLYYSEEEMALFRRLAKDGMKREHPHDFLKINLSDFLLTLLKKHYADADITLTPVDVRPGS